MIAFRCWYCGKGYIVPERRAGERINCTCRHPLRVPKRNGGNSRAKTATDWLVETLVYGGGGALLGLGLAVVILSKFRYFLPFRRGWPVIVVPVVLGFLAGTFGGEHGVNWVGRMIRAREDR